ncbi:hypothetical protein KOW79_006004 [Hemibagrus wyckioides]|uniref:Sushi domain-containing protein n=1 Tax=Hemibagrus wyckioides TaxID=337641 RepID=A0A9D3SMP0_9TELE|nr:complement factor H-like [Hemibagrus wyckioides]KAG7329782.1 hypothetical protein KOW79_006004 [Hemibagrus wyckioides]
MRVIILALSVWLCRAVKGQENCQRPALEKGFFVPHKEIYKHGVTISYGCDSGLKPALETWWGRITCNSGTWSHTPQCIDNTWCITPHVPNAQPTQQLASSYPLHATVAFRCNKGYEFQARKYQAKCVDGGWELPVCRKNLYSCDPPARVNNAIITKPYHDAFEHGDQLPYVCAKGYKPYSYSYTTCTDTRWYPEIKCERITCGKPEVQNSKPGRTLKDSYNIGDRVQFQCRTSYEFVNTDYAVCEETGTWNLPVCRPRSAVVCKAPRISHGSPAERLAESYATRTSVRFQCDRGYEFEQSAYAVCTDGQWNLPVCKRATTGGSAGGSENRETFLPVRDCGPQPLIENGDFTELPSGTELRFQCKVLYKRAGPEIVRCVSGEWTDLPVCKPPCKVDKSRIHSSYSDEYVPEGEKKTFHCPSSYYYTYSLTVQCINGQATYNHRC